MLTIFKENIFRQVSQHEYDNRWKKEGFKIYGEPTKTKAVEIVKPVAEPVVEPAIEAEPQQLPIEEPQNAVRDLSEMDIGELRSMAKRHGLEIQRGMNTEQIREVIRNANVTD